LITRIIFGDKYRSLSSSLCSLLHSPVASPLLGPNTLLSALFSNTLSQTHASVCIIDGMLLEAAGPLQTKGFPVVQCTIAL
jgi:hypothetical protein